MEIVKTPSVVRSAVRTAWGNTKRAMDAAENERERLDAEAVVAGKKVALLRAQFAELDRWLVDNPE